MSLTVETAGPNLVDGIVRTPSSWNDRETSQLWFLYFQIETESLTQFWSIKSLKSFFLKKISMNSWILTCIMHLLLLKLLIFMLKLFHLWLVGASLTPQSFWHNPSILHLFSCILMWQDVPDSQKEIFWLSKAI